MVDTSLSSVIQITVELVLHYGILHVGGSKHAVRMTQSTTMVMACRFFSLIKIRDFNLVTWPLWTVFLYTAARRGWTMQSMRRATGFCT